MKKLKARAPKAKKNLGTNKPIGSNAGVEIKPTQNMPGNGMNSSSMADKVIKNMKIEKFNKWRAKSDKYQAKGQYKTARANAREAKYKATQWGRMASGIGSGIGQAGVGVGLGTSAATTSADTKSHAMSTMNQLVTGSAKTENEDENRYQDDVRFE